MKVTIPASMPYEAAASHPQVRTEPQGCVQPEAQGPGITLEHPAQAYLISTRARSYLLRESNGSASSQLCAISTS